MAFCSLVVRSDLNDWSCDQVLMTVSGFSFAALLCTTSALLIAAALSLRARIAKSIRGE
jgi:hypothetical protein